MKTIDCNNCTKPVFCVRISNYGDKKYLSVFDVRGGRDFEINREFTDEDEFDSISMTTCGTDVQVVYMSGIIGKDSFMYLTSRMRGIEESFEPNPEPNDTVLWRMGVELFGKIRGNPFIFRLNSEKDAVDFYNKWVLTESCPYAP